MSNVFLDLLGNNAKSIEWQRVCSKLNSPPRIQKFPKGYWIAFFDGHGLEIYFAKHAVSSLVFYGPNAENSDASYSGNLVANLAFGQSEAKVKELLGNPVYTRLESPAGANEKCIRANFYEYADYCLIPRFDLRLNSELIYLECMQFKTASDAHGFISNRAMPNERKT